MSTKSAKTTAVNQKQQQQQQQHTLNDDDDWETDPDYVNNVSEKEQRTGIKTLAARNITEPVENTISKPQEILAKVVQKNDKAVISNYESNNFSRGYGGKFGKEDK